MHVLHLPTFNVQTTLSDGKYYIFDSFRKKNVRLTPEEWVRQHFMHYLAHHLGYPPALMKVEATKHLPNALSKRRADILIWDPHQGTPLMVVECKAASHKIKALTLAQMVQYNTIFEARFLTVTNGIDHFCYHKEPTTGHYQRLSAIPFFHTLKN